MKKFFLAILFIVISITCAGIFYFIPVGFHHLVHQELIAKSQESKGKVEFQKLSFHKHRSTFIQTDHVLGSDFKINIDTITGINPENYHFEIQMIDLKKQGIKYQFSVHWQITKSAKMRFLIKTQDFIKTQNENVLRLISPIIEIGDFDIFTELTEKRSLFELAMNKDLSITFKELSGEYKGDSHQIKDFSFQLQIIREADSISLKAQGTSQNYLGVMVNQPVLYNQVKSSFSVGTFNYQQAKKFVEDFLAQGSPLSQQNMLLLMSALGTIQFPVEVDTKLSGKLGKSEALFNINFQLKNKNFLDMNNYYVELISLNNRENTVKILNDTFIREHLKRKAELTKASVSRRLKELRIDVNNNKDQFLASLVKFSILKEKDSFYLIRAKLDAGIVHLHQKQIPLSQLYSLPHHVVNDFIQNKE